MWWTAALLGALAACAARPAEHWVDAEGLVAGVRFAGDGFQILFADEQGLRTVDGRKETRGPLERRPTPTARQPAPALEEADRAFARDTAARGVDGWVAAFDPQGAIWQDRRIEGPAAIREAMAPLFADPAWSLRWEPIASGLAPDGARGFTVGTWKSPRAHGVYVTLWRKQPDGGWKAFFDVGQARP